MNLESIRNKWKEHKYVESKQYTTNNQWVFGEIKKDIKNTLRQIKMGIQCAKSVKGIKSIIREKFTAISVYLRKQGKAHINKLNLHLKGLEMKNK